MLIPSFTQANDIATKETCAADFAHRNPVPDEAVALDRHRRLLDPDAAIIIKAFELLRVAIPT
jgi:hypothetical protein